MNLERLELIERYLGTLEKEGELMKAVREQTSALHNYHASLTLEHISASDRLDVLKEKSEAMVGKTREMLGELFDTDTFEDDPYQDLGVAG